VHLLDRISWWLTLFLMGLLLLSYVALYIPPDTFWYVGLLTLGYPYLLLVLIIVVIYWSFRKSYRVLLPLLVIGLGWSHLQRTFQFSWSSDGAEKEGYRVVSYNVSNLGFYDWRTRKQRQKQFFRLFSELDAEILCLQEFFRADYAPFQNVDSLLSRTDYRYAHFHPNFSIPRRKGLQEYGLAIFSKLPIKNKGYLSFPEQKNNGILYVDVQMDTQVTRVHNVHLQSLRIQEEDYKQLKQRKLALDNLKTLFRKLRNGYVERARQVRYLQKQLSSTDTLHSLAGDFNDVPVSYTYDYLMRHTSLQDAFVARGSGTGSTFDSPLPFLRIDYLLFDQRFEVRNYQRYPHTHSDHYPVTAEVMLN
jgi:endonuclease/exonuclease/phosphatase family metal-dependent hydrolase